MGQGDTGDRAGAGRAPRGPRGGTPALGFYSFYTNSGCVSVEQPGPQTAAAAPVLMEKLMKPSK